MRLGPETDIVDVTLGLDLTLRDVQAKLKKNGHSWELGKVCFPNLVATSAPVSHALMLICTRLHSQVFPDAAVLGPWVPKDSFDWVNEEFLFELDGKIVQRGQAKQQMLGPGPALHYIRSVFPTLPNDIVMTGEHL